MRWKRVVGLVVAVLAMGVLTAAPGAAPAQARGASASLGSRALQETARPAFKATPIDWRRCKDASLRKAKARCGLLTVPLDPNVPTGATIKVGVSRVLHSRGTYRGAIFTNPGGPGGSGLYLSTLGKYVPDKVGLSYDWYGFDPRGVGTSRPLVSCDKRYGNEGDRPLYYPTSKHILKYWLNKTEKYAADCASARGAAVLAHDTTADTVADYEVLRQAIGADQITWYGFSYGTYVGEVYATLHPDRVKAMVLDGVIGPAGAWYQANLDQNVAFQKPFEKFLAWIGKYPGVYHLGVGKKQVEATYRRVRQQLIRQPVANGTFGPDELDDALLSAAYYNVTWLEEAGAFSALVNNGDPKPLVKLWRGQDPVNDDNGYADYLGVQCSDAPWPTDWATWAADAKRTAKKGPFETWSNTWYNAPCRTWPYPSSPQIQVSGAAYTGPVLMTEQSLDPATPYAGALAARALFPSARLVVGVGGTSHAVSLFGVACTDDAVAAVLRDGSLPTRKAGDGADRKCPPLLPPDPTKQPRSSADGAHAFPWQRLLPYLMRAQHLL